METNSKSYQYFHNFHTFVNSFSRVYLIEWNAIAQVNETNSVPEVTSETPSDGSTEEDNKRTDPEIFN